MRMQGGLGIDGASLHLPDCGGMGQPARRTERHRGWSGGCQIGPLTSNGATMFPPAVEIPALHGRVLELGQVSSTGRPRCRVLRGVGHQRGVSHSSIRLGHRRQHVASANIAVSAWPRTPARDAQILAGFGREPVQEEATERPMGGIEGAARLGPGARGRRPGSSGGGWWGSMKSSRGLVGIDANKEVGGSRSCRWWWARAGEETDSKHAVTTASSVKSRETDLRSGCSIEMIE
jgi:hypothetical protein